MKKHELSVLGIIAGIIIILLVFNLSSTSYSVLDINAVNIASPQKDTMLIGEDVLVSVIFTPPEGTVAIAYEIEVNLGEAQENVVRNLDIYEKISFSKQFTITISLQGTYKIVASMLIEDDDGSDVGGSDVIYDIIPTEGQSVLYNYKYFTALTFDPNPATTTTTTTTQENPIEYPTQQQSSGFELFIILPVLVGLILKKKRGDKDV